MYYSGSWQVKRMDTQVTKAFDWAVTPAPCGPAACTAMPAALRSLASSARSSRHWWRSSSTSATDANYKGADGAHREHPGAPGGVAKAGVTYNVSPGAKAALNSFVADVAKIAKPNYPVAGLSLQPCDLPANSAASRSGGCWRNVRR